MVARSISRSPLAYLLANISFVLSLLLSMVPRLTLVHNSTWNALRLRSLVEAVLPLLLSASQVLTRAPTLALPTTFTTARSRTLFLVSRDYSIYRLVSNPTGRPRGLHL